MTDQPTERSQEDLDENGPYEIPDGDQAHEVVSAEDVEADE